MVSNNSDTSINLINQGVDYVEQKNYRMAAKYFLTASKIAPNNWVAAYNLGIVNRFLGYLVESKKNFLSALNVNQNDARIYNDLATVLKDLGEVGRAVANFQKATELSPTFSEPKYNLGLIQAEKGHHMKAQKLYKKAFELDQNNDKALTMYYQSMRSNCNWGLNRALEKKLDAITTKKILKSELPGETPFLNVTRKQNNKQALGIAKLWSLETEAKVTPINRTSSINKGKIRIGYVSDGFRDYPTGHNIASIFKNHNKDKFEIFAYYYGANDKSIYRKVIEQHSDKFSQIQSFGHLETAELIASHGIDILVDLKGHTREIRQEIFAFKPAPVIITWLGFPGTTGANFCDYIIADKTVIPENAKKYFSEKVLYLPCYRMADSTTKIQKTKQKRSNYNIKAGQIVYASLNASYKIELESFSAWMDILNQNKNSILILQVENKVAMKNLLNFAKKKGVSKDRIIFINYVSKSTHLARVRDLVDIALDTFTVNGHTTTTDAIQVGVPVVTLIGNHFCSRVSASVLHNTGLSNLVANTTNEYVKTAVDLGRNTNKLNDIKMTLEKAKQYSLVLNPKRFTEELENIYSEVAENGQ